jgi:SAM-dependent methyltransferase
MGLVLHIAQKKRDRNAMDRQNTTAFTVDGIEFEDVDCLICGSNQTIYAGAIKWRETDLHYVLCKKCGLKYMKPRPTRDWYARFYEKQFWHEKIVNRGYYRSNKRKLKAEAGIQKKVTKQLSNAKQIFGIVSEAMKLTDDHLVLEIGASWGVSLNFLRRRTGCQVLAVEPSDVARAYIQKKYAIPLIGRVMEDLYEPLPIDGKVDLVIFSHVLENIVNPLQALEAVRNLLSPSGLVYIDTCNFYYNDAMNPYHPFIFGPETLKALLGKAGFKVIRMHCEDHPRIAIQPSNRYLKILAQKGQFVSDVPALDAEQLRQDQIMGLEHIERSKLDKGKANIWTTPFLKKLKTIWKKSI